MRELVLLALTRLSDLDHQERAWVGSDRRPEDAFDSIKNVIHALYDDTDALGDPDAGVGFVLRPSEVGPMRELATLFDPIIDELGAGSAEQYLAHPQWPAVVTAAGEALAVCLSD